MKNENVVIDGDLTVKGNLTVKDSDGNILFNISKENNTEKAMHIVTEIKVGSFEWALIQMKWGKMLHRKSSLTTYNIRDNLVWKSSPYCVYLSKETPFDLSSLMAEDWEVVA